MQDIPIIYEVAPKVIDKIKTDVRQVNQTVFENKPVIKMSVSRWWIVLYWVLSIVGIILLVGGYFATEFLVSFNYYLASVIAFCVAGATCCLIALPMIQTTRKARGLFNTVITNKEIAKYYNMVAQNHLPYWTVNSIEQNFSAPLGFESDTLKCSNVVYGMYGNYQYEFGTKYDLVSIKNNKTYTWYWFFTCRFNNTNFQTIITPSFGYLGLPQPNSKYELESPTFEKMFTVDYTYPIQLRKVLTPAVMNNLINTKVIANKNNLQTPSIFICNDSCVLRWEAGETHVYDPKHMFGGGLFAYNRNFEKMVDNSIEKLLEDMRRLTIALRWAASFDRW